MALSRPFLGKAPLYLTLVDLGAPLLIEEPLAY
jgi:hypothetical protein